MPPSNILVMACLGDLGDPYAGFVEQHLAICPDCQLKASAICGLFQEFGQEFKDSTPHQVAHIAISPAVRQDWRKTTYNCGDSEFQPRSHLLFGRPLTIASVEDAPPGSTTSHGIRIRPFAWSPRPHLEPAMMGQRPDEVAKTLHLACKRSEGVIPVFIPADDGRLLEAFLRDGKDQWRVRHRRNVPWAESSPHRMAVSSPEWEHLLPNRGHSGGERQDVGDHVR